nr:uncharacterized protein LOC115259432 [Aedes albopictus]
MSDVLLGQKKVVNDAGEEKTITTCLLCGETTKTFKCETKFNLSRHIVTSLKAKATEIGLLTEEESMKSQADAKQKVVIWIDPNVYVTSMVQWVTEGNLPFRFFDTPYARNILEPMEKGLKLPHVGRKSIVKYLESVEQHIVQCITDKLRGNMLSLKMDLASRKGRSVLGINAQIIDNGKITVYTLGMIERFERNTAESLRAEILLLLKKFNVGITQIYTVTTDNGSNMIKATKLLKNEQSLLMAELEDPKTTNAEFLDRDDDDTESLKSFSADEVEYTEEIDDLENLNNAHLTGVRCAAHDVQLSVYDVFKKKSVTIFLAKARKLVKTLRAQPYGNSFRLDKSKKLPFFDGDTRWGSSHLMVDCLRHQKDFIMSLLTPDLKKQFGARFWSTVDQFVQATRPVYVLTKRIQEEALTSGSFYLYWKECTLELEDICSSLAKQLNRALKDRQHMWMDNEAFLAALYMDLRLNDFNPPVLNPDQQERAIKHILKTWENMKMIRGSEAQSTTDAGDPVPSTSSATSLGRLTRVEQLLSVNRQARTSDFNDMEKRIRRLRLEPSLPLDTDIISWWQVSKPKEKDLVMLALVILQIPCTQVSVERAFNGLGQILTRFRTRLGPGTLGNVLFVKANSDLLREHTYKLKP